MKKVRHGITPDVELTEVKRRKWPWGPSTGDVVLATGGGRWYVGRTEPRANILNRPEAFDDEASARARFRQETTGPRW